MRKLLLFISITLLPCLLQAQSELTNGLLFPKFTEGIVLKKGGERIVTQLNYNSVEEEMLFRNAGEILTLADLNNIVTVTINKRCFVPAQKDAFYEEIEAGKGNFYIQWKSKLISKGKSIGYGGSSETAAVTGIGSVQGKGADYARFNLEEKYETKTERVFYLRIGKSFKKFTSSKTLGKLFKEHENKIEEFAKTNSIDFTKAGDIKKIVEYAYGL